MPGGGEGGLVGGALNYLTDICAAEQGTIFWV